MMSSNNKRGGFFNIIFSFIVLLVLCGVLAISACYAVTPTTGAATAATVVVGEQIVKNRQQPSSNNIEEQTSNQEFTYIKNLIHSPQAERNEISNILQMNDQDFTGNERRTYLQQFREKLVNTHKGKLHFNLKLDEEEEDEDDEEENGAGEHSSNRHQQQQQNYHQLYNVNEADIIDLEQQKHAHTDEDNGDDTTTQLDSSVSLVRRSIDASSSGDGSSSTTTSNIQQSSSSKGNAGMPSSNGAAEVTNTRVKLLFDPPSLDFEERPLCNPIAKTFTITKEDGDEEEALQITSVSTESLLFHPSISKKENNKMTINVIFLPRILKRSEGVITINTNFGVFTFKAFGGGIENAYNIKPILGHKLPVGADYRKPIHMYNPHQNESLLIKEIYTSEDFLLLSLPDQNSNDKTYNKKNPLLSLWKIEPHQTKSIILLNFHANQPKKQTGFVHINTNRGQFIIPVEFIVSKSGVHRVVDEIDFGTFISTNEKRTRDIVLLNSSPNPVLVSEASIANVDTQLKLEFTKNTILQEGSISTVAKVTYSSQTQGQFTGKIILKTNDTTSNAGGLIEVPYRSRIIHGTLDYKMNNTAFYCGDGKEKVNEMILMNGFDVPIKFTSADVFDKRFTIEDFTPGSILDRGSKKRVLSIRYRPSDSYLIHKTNLILHTNITRLYIPLYSYHGNLDHIPINSEKNILDIGAANEAINMGIIGLSSRKIHYFTVSNMNPVPIKIFDWKVIGMTNKKSSISISYVKVYQTEDVLGSLTLIKPTKLSDSINSKHTDGPKDSFIFAILPNQKIIMRLDIYTPTSDEEQNGFIEFITQYKSLAIPLKFICMEGSLSITNQLPFDVTFPGKIQKKNVYATNTFGRAITISDIKTSDERFIPVLTHKTIEANQKMNIGYVTLDASKIPKEKNYMMDDGKSSSSNSYNKKSSTISSEEFTKYRWRNSLFEDIKNAGDTNILGTISLQTDIGITYNINVSTVLEYPKLSPIRQINFKLTHIGTSASQYLTVENPSDHFISLQLILGNGSLAKFLQRNAKGNVPKIDGQGGDKSYTEFRLPKDGMNSANIPPHRHANLGPIIFTPKSDSATSVAYLYIRNNLTIFDIVKLTGNGGSSKLIFSENGNDLASLKFEIKESQLGTWDNYTNRFVQNNYSSSSSSSSNNGSEESSSPKNELIFHKKFILQNKGNMPVTILGSSIDNMGCHAYGVKLHKCGKFELQPGQQTSYKISYKPDFTTAVVDLFIRIETDQGKLSYPIRLTLPYNVLPYFYETQPISAGHRLFRVAATFIVLTLALYIIFRACRELKTLDSGDNELPTSITDFLKPNFSISSFPFITFPSMDAEKSSNQNNKNDEEKVLNAEEENKKKKSSEKVEKKKKPKNSPSIPKLDKSKKQKQKASFHHNEEEEEKPTQAVETESTSTGGVGGSGGGDQKGFSEPVIVDNLLVDNHHSASTTRTNKQILKEEKEDRKHHGQSSTTTTSTTTATTISSSSATSDNDTQAANSNVEKKSIYKKLVPEQKKSQPVDKKLSFASSSKKKFSETESANIVIKPKAFNSVPNNANNSNSGEKPKFYAVKAAENSTASNHHDVPVPSPTRSRTPNSNEMARFGRENPMLSSSNSTSSSGNSSGTADNDHHHHHYYNNMMTESSLSSSSSSTLPLDVVETTTKTRERSSSDSATYKNLLEQHHNIATIGSSNQDEKSTCSSTTDIGSTGNLSGLLNDSDSANMAPSPSSSNYIVEHDVLSLLRSASVSPPPIGGGQSCSPGLNATTTNQHNKEQVGVIGSNNTRRDMFGFGQSSQPYWYFGGAPSTTTTTTTTSFFGQGNNFIGGVGGGVGSVGGGSGGSGVSGANGGIGNSNASPFTPNSQFNGFGAPVVNRLAATFQQRPSTNYFSLFDSRPNSLFSTDTNSSFFSNLNQRSNNSSPSNSDSTTGTPDITSSLFSYVLPAEDARDEQQIHHHHHHQQQQHWK